MTASFRIRSLQSEKWRKELRSYRKIKEGMSSWSLLLTVDLMGSERVKRRLHSELSPFLLSPFRTTLKEMAPPPRSSFRIARWKSGTLGWELLSGPLRMYVYVCVCVCVWHIYTCWGHLRQLSSASTRSIFPPSHFPSSSLTLILPFRTRSAGAVSQETSLTFAFGRLKRNRVETAG